MKKTQVSIFFEGGNMKCIFFFFSLSFYLFFLAILFSLYLSLFSSVFAEETEGIAHDEVTTSLSCEETLLKGISEIDLEYKKELSTFLDLRSSVSASKAKTLPLYLTNYQCNLRFICQALKNPEIKTFSDSISACSNRDAKEFLKKYDLDFSGCATPTQNKRSTLLVTCERFIDLKKKEAFQFTSASFIAQSALENQSFLAIKLVGLMKRMDNLYEKTKIFSRNFNVVMGDIQCTIPEKSS